jgi:hypothetical protein
MRHYGLPYDDCCKATLPSRIQTSSPRAQAQSCDVIGLAQPCAQNPRRHLANASVNKEYLNTLTPAMLQAHYHTHSTIRTPCISLLQTANQSITFESILPSIDYNID